MPRDGSGVYTQPFPDVVSGTTIESAKYNGNVNDVEQDLNTPRPIVAGGTGANNALDARKNIDAEVSGTMVTNYDSHVWEAGSFWSIDATAGPIGATGMFSGTCTIVADNPAYIQLEAVQHGATGGVYHREKATTWGAWKQQAGSVADLDAAYVNVAGDTMVGDLNINKANPAIWMVKGGTSEAAAIYGSIGASARWLMMLGDNSGNSNFVLRKYDDGGVFSGNAITIDRQYGDATFMRHITANGAVISAQTATGGTYYFGNSGTKYLQYDGTNFFLKGGTQLSVDNSIRITKTAAADTALYLDENSGPARMIITFESATGRSTMKDLYSGHNIFIDPGGSFTYSGSTAYKQGGGSWLASSDARIKTVIGDYTQGLDEVVQLHPVAYVYKGNDTPTATLDKTDLEGKVVEVNSGQAPYPASGHYDVAQSQKPFVGFVAQELEQVFPGMVSERAGFIDGQAVTDLKDVDISALVYALVNSVKTLVARIEALEGTATPR